MRYIVTMFLLSALGCDPGGDTDFRENGSSSGGDCEPPLVAPMGVATETWPCACQKPEDCKPGLECVPLPDSKEMRCFAPMVGETPGGGGYITSCMYQGEERAAFYPWGAGNSPPFCSACIGCAPPLAESLICQ